MRSAGWAAGTEGGIEGEYMHGQHQPMKHDQVPQHSTNQNLNSDHMWSIQ